MKKLLRPLMDRLRQPKWRHGKLSALLMIGFVLACVLVNIAVSALEDEYGWRKDMSFNRYATTSQVTQDALSQLTMPVEMYLLYQNGSEDTRVLEVLNRYRVQSDYVSVIPTDIAKNPAILTRFSGDADTALAADSVVVYCPQTERYQVLDYGSFFTWGYNIDAGTYEAEGLAYERALTEALVYVTRDHVPTLGYLQGHGEFGAESLVNLTDYLRANAIDSQPVNLLHGDTLDGVDVLLIAGLQNDLTTGETETISAYAQSGGSLLVIRDYTDPLSNVPNYIALLRSYGVIPLPGVVVADEADTASYYGEPLYLLPYMESTHITDPLIASGSDVLLMPAACAFETPAQGDSSLNVATVLKTGEHAYIRSLTDGQNTLEKQEGDREGVLSLALYATRMHANSNISRMFAVGNSAMFMDNYIYQSSYSEAFISSLMQELAPESSGITLDISATSAFRPALTAGSQTMGIVLLVLLPMLTLIVALCVLLPRYNR